MLVGGVWVIEQSSAETWGKPTGRAIRMYSTRGVAGVWRVGLLDSERVRVKVVGTWDLLRSL